MTRKQVIGLIFLLICISTANIILNINDFIFLKSSNYTDIAISHFPNLLFIQQTISQHHQIPLWSNLILAGYPFAANPLSGLWYLFGWVAVLFPLPMGININLIIHISSAFVGLFIFLREEGRSNPGAVFGAIVFSLSTRLFSHLGAGHLSLIYAVSWTPWLLLFTRKYSNSSLWYKQLFPGIIFGFIFTADPRWILPAGLIWFFYLLKLKRGFKSVGQIGILSFITGLVTSAGAWLPLIQYIPLTTRSLLTNQDKLIYSLDFEKLIGFFIPEFGGFSEWVVYPGAISVLLFVFGIFIYKENKEIRFWYYAALISLVLSLGSNFPFVNTIFSLPVFSLLRVPPRFIWLFFLSIAVIGSFVMDYLVSQEKNYKFDRIFFISPVIAFVILISVGVVFVTGNITINMIWASFFYLISFICIAIVYHRKINRVLYSLLFIGILFIDLTGINIQSLRFKSSRDVLNIPTDLENILASLPSYARIYTPSYSLTQEQAGRLGIAQINGIDPMQLSGYVNYFSLSSGIPVEQYTVTLPPFNNGDPKKDNAAFCPEKEYLRNLNVFYILSNFEFVNCIGWEQFQKLNDIYVYQLEGKFASDQTNNERLIANISEYTPNKIVLLTSESANMVLSEVYYPGWIAFVDGEKTVVNSNGIFRAIEVPAGEHVVELLFRPFPVYLGVSIQLLGLIFFMFLVIRKK